MKKNKNIRFFSCIALIIFLSPVYLNGQIIETSLYDDYGMLNFETPKKATFFNDSLQIYYQNFEEDDFMKITIIYSNYEIKTIELYGNNCIYRVKEEIINGHQFIFVIVKSDCGSASYCENESVYIFRQKEDQLKYLMTFESFAGQHNSVLGTDFLYGSYRIINNDSPKAGINFFSFWNPCGEDIYNMFGFGYSFCKSST